jgi:hypothetical protein
MYTQNHTEFTMTPGFAIASTLANWVTYVGFMYYKYPAGTEWLWTWVVEPYISENLWPHILDKYLLSLWKIIRLTTYYWTIQSCSDAIIGTLNFATQLYLDARLYWWDYPIMCQERVAAREAALVQIQFAFENALITADQMALAIQKLSVDLYNHRPGCNCFPLPVDYSVKIMEANQARRDGEDIHWFIRFIGDICYLVYTWK